MEAKKIEFYGKFFFWREFVLPREFLGANSLRNFRCKFPLPAGIYPKFPLPAGIYKFPLTSAGIYKFPLGSGNLQIPAREREFRTGGNFA